MEWLRSLGLNKKQQRLYLYLLENGAQSASQLATGLAEQRTNVYLLTESLVKKGLVERLDTQSVTKFIATDPSVLQTLMADQQKELAASSVQMKKALPELLGLYQVNSAKEGLAYFEGLKGYTAALDDMVRSSTPVCVFGSGAVDERLDALRLLEHKLQQRSVAKISTRMILDNSLAGSTLVDLKALERVKVAVRFWGDALFTGEMAIYGSTVVLTTYDDKLISLVIKNQAIAGTMQSIFNTAWEAATQD